MHHQINSKMCCCSHFIQLYILHFCAAGRKDSYAMLFTHVIMCRDFSYFTVLMTVDWEMESVLILGDGKWKWELILMLNINCCFISIKLWLQHSHLNFFLTHASVGSTKLLVLLSKCGISRHWLCFIKFVIINRGLLMFFKSSLASFVRTITKNFSYWFTIEN